MATAGGRRGRGGGPLWRGAHQVEVTASPDGGRPVVAVETGRTGLADRPSVEAGLVVNGRTRRRPDRVHFDVLGHRFEVSAGVFWQVHPGAADVLTRCRAGGPGTPGRGSGWPTSIAGPACSPCRWPRRSGPRGSVVAVERSAPGLCRRRPRTPTVSTRSRSSGPTSTPASWPRGWARPTWWCWTPPGRVPGRAVMGALASLRAGAPADGLCLVRPGLRSPGTCGCVLDAGWTMDALRAFDLFPMTEHVELVAILRRPARPARAGRPRNAVGAGTARPVRGRRRGRGVALVGVARRRLCRAAPLPRRRPEGPQPAGAGPVADRRRGVPARSPGRHQLGPRGAATVSTADLGGPPLPVPLRLSDGVDRAVGQGAVELAETTAYFDKLAARWARPAICRAWARGHSRPPTARWSCARTGRCCWWTPPGFPAQFGVPPTSSGDVAVTVGDVILGAGPATESPEAVRRPSVLAAMTVGGDRLDASPGTSRPTIRRPRSRSAGGSFRNWGAPGAGWGRRCR